MNKTKMVALGLGLAAARKGKRSGVKAPFDTGRCGALLASALLGLALEARAKSSKRGR